jgi:DNA-binding NtrC family response regulator
MQPNEPTRVLLVEDNSSDARSIERWLRASTAAFSTETTAELTSAIMALQHKSFDVVLLDLTLPDSQGVETVEKVYRITHAPILVLSGHEDLATAMNCVREGAWPRD